MKSLFEPETHQDILIRIEKLNENTQAQWGKMDVAQMLKHCQLTLEIANGKRQMKATGGFFLKKMVFKAIKPMMYNDKPWKHNLGTAKELIIADSYTFETEKNNIVNLINEFVGKREINNWPLHPLFGHFTTEQRGQMQYKHLDHHLTQFGV